MSEHGKPGRVVGGVGTQEVMTEPVGPNDAGFNTGHSIHVRHAAVPPVRLHGLP